MRLFDNWRSFSRGSKQASTAWLLRMVTAGVWIQVVREQLAAKHPVDEMLTRSLSAPSWGTWPPDWWPQEPAAESGLG